MNREEACLLQFEWMSQDMLELTACNLKDLWSFAKPLPREYITMDDDQTTDWMIAYLTGLKSRSSLNYVLADFINQEVYCVIGNSLTSEEACLFRLGFEEPRSFDKVLTLPASLEKVLSVSKDSALVAVRSAAKVEILKMYFNGDLEILGKFDFGDFRVSAASLTAAGLFVLAACDATATLYLCQGGALTFVIALPASAPFFLDAAFTYLAGAELVVVDLPSLRRRFLPVTGAGGTALVPDYANDLIRCDLRTILKPLYL